MISIHRREFVHGLGFSMLGLGMADQVALAAARGDTDGATGFGRAKHCIFLFLYGGPSQIDTWDMKPEAPVEYRGEFQPIRTAVPGIDCCEHMPKLAARTQHLAVIRSITMQGRVAAGDHHIDAYYALTGQRPDAATVAQGINRKPHHDDWPFMGATAAYCRPVPADLPACVQLPFYSNEFSGYVVPGQFAGKLGPAYEPLLVHGTPDPAVKHGFKPREFSVPHFSLPDEIDGRRLGGRRDLLTRLDTWHRRIDQNRVIDSYSAHEERAFTLLSSLRVKEAFDLDREPEDLRARYGNTVNGQGALMARRLVEAGVPFVCVHWRTPERSPLVANWDTHADNFFHLREELLPEFDTLLSALLDDLDQRGLLESTLVLAMGEMGRTPRWNDPRVRGTSYQPGRDHWVNCMFALMAGGGVRGGQVYGASDRVSAYPAEKPVWPGDIAATVYHALGIRDEQLVYTHRDGRPIRLLDEGASLPLF